MYDKDDFCAEARGSKMLIDFKKFALRCGGIAQKVDGNIPERFLVDLCENAKHLNLELEAMLSRNKRKVR